MNTLNKIAADFTSWGQPRSKYGDTYRKQALAARREVLAQNPDYDVASYARGWRDSGRWDTVSSPLDLGDARGECEAWYDGYYDRAVGRDRWHQPLWDEMNRRRVLVGMEPLEWS